VGPEYEGIGAVSTPHGDSILLVTVVENGGADEAGLIGGELVLAIDGVFVAELDMRTATEMMRGPAGTTVTPRIETPAGEVRDAEVPRRSIGGS
jgi:carboxyl-terminal processing protease